VREKNNDTQQNSEIEWYIRDNNMINEYD